MTDPTNDRTAVIAFHSLNAENHRTTTVIGYLPIDVEIDTRKVKFFYHS